MDASCKLFDQHFIRKSDLNGTIGRQCLPRTMSRIPSSHHNNLCQALYLLEIVTSFLDTLGELERKSQRISIATYPQYQTILTPPFFC